MSSSMKKYQSENLSLEIDTPINKKTKWLTQKKREK